MSSSFLIAGCGYVGMRLAELLLAEGHAVIGLRRRWPAAYPAGLAAVAHDVTMPEAFLSLPPSGVSHVIYAVAADGASDESYRRAYLDGLAQTIAFAQRCVPAIERFVFVSSTGVYGPGHGEWVDETTPVTTVAPFAAARMAEAEALLAASGLPGVAVRFGGIYGPGRQSLADEVARGAARLTGADTWTNRIHLEDCARALRFLALHPAPAAVYVAVDDEPAPRDEILVWLAAELGRPVPPTVASAAPPSQRGNRRCRNTRLKAAGFSFAYPTYREGFRAILGGALPLR